MWDDAVSLVSIYSLALYGRGQGRGSLCVKPNIRPTSEAYPKKLGVRRVNHLVLGQAERSSSFLDNPSDRYRYRYRHRYR